MILNTSPGGLDQSLGPTELALGGFLVLELLWWVNSEASSGTLVVFIASLRELKVLTECETSDRNCREDLLTMNLNFPQVHLKLTSF